MYNDRSRLNKRLENRTKRNIVLTIAAAAIILYLLLRYGVNFLADGSLYLSGSDTTQTQKTKKDQYVATPFLNPIPSATNSASVIVSGSALENQKVKLYVNDNDVEEESVDDKGNFSFTYTKLKKGENKIKVQAVTKNEQKSDFSPQHTINYTDKAPQLSIESPSDGQTISKDPETITITGKTAAGSKVYVNDFWAIVDEDGNFAYSLKLQNGENKIKLKAVDEAGNKTEKEIKVTFNP